MPPSMDGLVGTIEMREKPVDEEHDRHDEKGDDDNDNYRLVTLERFAIIGAVNHEHHDKQRQKRNVH